MEKPVIRISVRNLVEFILRSGDLDSRRGAGDKEAMVKGSRLHRKIQKQMGSNYRAEVALKWETVYDDLIIQVEGRADGIQTEDGRTTVDEIKGIYGKLEHLNQPVEIHRAQAMRAGETGRNYDSDDLCKPGYGRSQAFSGNHVRGIFEDMVPKAAECIL